MVLSYLLLLLLVYVLAEARRCNINCLWLYMILHLWRQQKLGWINLASHQASVGLENDDLLRRQLTLQMLKLT